MHKLTEHQKTWIKRILDDSTYNSGFTVNLGSIIRTGKYTNSQRNMMNKSIIPQYMHYLKTGYVTYRSK